MEGWYGMKERDSGTRPLVLHGAIDMHCHFGPEPLVEKLSKVPHSVDPIEAAQQAAQQGMRALVLKAHEFPSTAAAYLANRVVPDVASIAGICLDHPVGGLNPHAVEVALRNGAQVVWLPTISAQGANAAALQQFFGVDEGIRVLDDNGELLPVVREIMDLIAEHDGVLATGHISKEAHFEVARAFGERGSLVVTHAMHETTGPRLSVQETVELSELGAVIEFTAHTCMGSPSTFGAVIDVIGRIDVGRAIVATDYGWSVNVPAPGPGMVSYINELWDAGIDEERLRAMACDTPARLLRLVP